MDKRLTPYIEAALQKADGNKTIARRYLIEAAVKDMALLQLLTLPFLESITTHALDRHLHGSSAAGLTVPQTPPATDRKEPPPSEASLRHANNMKALAAAFQKKK